MYMCLKNNRELLPRRSSPSLHSRGDSRHRLGDPESGALFGIRGHVPEGYNMLTRRTALVGAGVSHSTDSLHAKDELPPFSQGRLRGYSNWDRTHLISRVVMA